MRRRRKAKQTASVPPPGPVPKSGLEKSPAQSDAFGKALRISAGAHAIAAIVLVILGAVFSRPSMRFNPSIQVDLVGMPELTKRELHHLRLDSRKASKNAKPTEPPPPKAADHSMAFKIKRRRELEKEQQEERQNAINRIKALSEIEAQVDKKPSPTRPMLKGVQLSKGDMAEGDVSTADLNSYVSSMQAKLRQNWDLPVWLANQNLKALVRVFVDHSGYVISAVLTKSSGNAQFDEYALKTIRASQPFGPAPAQLVEDGATLAFPVF